MQYDPLDYLQVQVDKKKNHIQIIHPERCQKNCDNKACTIICPTDVYHFQEFLDVRYWRCLECGACEIVCSNISWIFPLPPYGVSYKKN